MGLREGLEGRVDLRIVDSPSRGSSEGRSEVSRFKNVPRVDEPPRRMNSMGLGEGLEGRAEIPLERDKSVR